MVVHVDDIEAFCLENTIATEAYSVLERFAVGAGVVMHGYAGSLTRPPALGLKKCLHLTGLGMVGAFM